MVDPKFSGLVPPSAQVGTVHKEFVPTGQTVNFGFYCKVLRKLHEKVRRHRPQLWREQTWLLHHDNAPSHTAVLTHQFLAKNKTALIPHPSYSPDLAPCDFFLFPKMKLKLTGRRFDTIEEIQAETQKVLDTLDRKGLPGSVPKMEETVGPVSTCERELLRGWWQPIGLMASFMIFTALVRKILDQPSYQYYVIKSGYDENRLTKPVFTFAAVLLWFIDKILFNIWRSLSFSFGFRPLFLLADYILPRFVYVIITLENAALETPNKVAILVTDAPAKRAPTVCPLGKSDKSPILQYFHTNSY